MPGTSRALLYFRAELGAAVNLHAWAGGFSVPADANPHCSCFVVLFLKNFFFFSLIFRAVGLFVLWSSVLECIKVFKQGQGQGMGTQGFASTPALLCSLQSREESGGLANTCREIRQPLVILTSKTWQRRAGREAEKGPGRPSECSAELLSTTRWHLLELRSFKMSKRRF